MSVFGNFGANATQNNTNPFGGGAAQNNNNNQAGSSLFGGGAANNQAKPSIFGSTGAFGQPQQQQQQQGQQQQQSAFGSSTSTPNLFGSTNNNNQQPPPAGNNLFGSTQPATNTNTLGSFGSTSNTNTNTTTPSLFGNTSNNNNNNGQQQQQQQPQQQQQQNNLFGGGGGGSNLFGAKPAGSTGAFGQQPSTGMFGQSNQQPQQQQQQQQQQQGGSLGSFGQSSTNPLFGSTNNNPLTASALGGSTLGARGPGHQQADAQTQFSRLVQKIESVQQAWDPTSPQCRFQHAFYNLVDPNQVSLYGRPPNATNDVIWEKAVRENPEPSCLVPVIATGFDDLRMRVDAQTDQAKQHQERLKEIQERLKTLKNNHATSTLTKLSRYSSAQTQLMARLLALIQHLHLLIPAIRSSSIRPEEEELRSRLEKMEEEIMGGGGRSRGKLGELWAVVGALRARGAGASNGRAEWQVVDEDGLARIAQVLSEQQSGLAHLTKILQKALTDLSIISRADDYDSDMFSSSTNTVRG